MDSKPLARLRHALSSGNLWLAILSVLGRKKAYAYALPGIIERRFGFRPSRIMTYVVLYKLEEEGIIASAFRERRNYYALTKRGRAVLSEGKGLLAKTAARL